jgi:hypothetical protein
LIAWILEQENENGEYEALKIFLKTINAKVPLNPLKKENEIKISREENNIDLIIKWKENEKLNYVFIENKMKSIPTSDQLKKYNVKIKKYTDQETSNKFLLTPFSTLLQNADDTNKWINITYKEEIIQFLNEIKNLNFKNTTNKQIKVNSIIELYTDLILNQQQILNNFKIDNDNENSFLNQPYNFYIDTNKIMSNLRELRIHDLVLKLIHDRISKILNEKLEIAPRRCEAEFSNSTGMTSIDYFLGEGEKFIIGLQLQGNFLRYYLLKKEASVTENQNLAISLFQNKLWFHDIISNEPLLGNGRRKEDFNELGMNDRAFCEYGKGIFLYFYKSLDVSNNNLLIKDVIDLMVNSIEHFHKNKAEMLKLID